MTSLADGQYETACPYCGAAPLALADGACTECGTAVEAGAFTTAVVAIDCPVCSCSTGFSDDDGKIRCLACHEVQPESKARTHTDG
jgi:DNA-directed RNA polymerase subunit RPC12/RpoP